MATYVIGDVQGCFDELQALLKQLRFDKSRDRLWFCGDLVNRGPGSLEVLRFVKGLGTAARTVLGNHDLHLLALADGRSKHRKKDTLRPILNAPDREALLHWLRHQPLLIHDRELAVTIVHAGLPPQWSIDEARDRAAEVEQVLQGPKHRDYFADMYGDQPDTWNENLQGMDRLRFITNCLTRLRYCDHNGRLMLRDKSAPDGDSDYFPWYEVPGRRSRDARIIFGHWSTLGLVQRQDVTCLDDGCIWGGGLVALELESGQVIRYDCEGRLQPGTD